jgi:hypothetical protein
VGFYKVVGIERMVLKKDKFFPRMTHYHRENVDFDFVSEKVGHDFLPHIGLRLKPRRKLGDFRVLPYFRQACRVLREGQPTFREPRGRKR